MRQSRLRKNSNVAGVIENRLVFEINQFIDLDFLKLRINDQVILHLLFLIQLELFMAIFVSSGWR